MTGPGKYKPGDLANRVPGTGETVKKGEQGGISTVCLDRVILEGLIAAGPKEARGHRGRPARITWWRKLRIWNTS